MSLEATMLDRNLDRASYLFGALGLPGALLAFSLLARAEEVSGRHARSAGTFRSYVFFFKLTIVAAGSRLCD